ncbi:SubName: Full=Uncharacterized protein {ECO:0000313/EMBL:CCA73902.1} [Serendipita indica DSM 11827]|uniref:Uncharacterized protein n=1 Tax=Serendipita indica (strain DSM 11827) TaxID=1109443 RepID=G4TRF9_SERID|nr:SubName: Full=Uncharacterized protein {ECO:0000313/EMBL:CCA73902.1} [Serendipita indica DSM 11827]CCA73902.1 hypothetical protein PIIN_07855 [Serendipita indica DSM 11827]
MQAILFSSSPASTAFFSSSTLMVTTMVPTMARENAVSSHESRATSDAAQAQLTNVSVTTVSSVMTDHGMIPTSAPMSREDATSGFDVSAVLQVESAPMFRSNAHSGPTIEQFVASVPMERADASTGCTPYAFQLGEFSNSGVVESCCMSRTNASSGFSIWYVSIYVLVWT